MFGQNLTIMKPITPAQLKLIHTLLGQLSLTDQKSDMVYSFSHGRTESSRELSLSEAKEMIEFLKNKDDSSRIIKAIWYLARQTNIISGITWEDNKLNSAKLDMFCRSRGAVKKPIGEQSLKELKRTQRQFESIYKQFSEKEARKVSRAEAGRRLKECVMREDYESAAVLKQLIDDIDRTLQSKRKKSSVKI